MQPPHARNVRTGQRGGPNFVRAPARALRELSDVAGTAANSVSTRHAGVESGGMGTVSNDIGCCEPTEERIQVGAAVVAGAGRSGDGDAGPGPDWLGRAAEAV